MNLSVIEKMVRDGDMSADAMRYLINCRGECEWLDFKERFNLDDDRQVCEFARDALAMKNVGGGYIIVGIEDKTWLPKGLQHRLTYDTKLLRDQIRRATNVDLDVDIVQHDLHLPNSSGKFALILIRASNKRRKRRTPTLVGRDFCTAKPYGFRRGEIYARRGDSTIRIKTTEELGELLDALESQADQDALNASATSSSFAIQDGYYRLLEPGFETFIGRHKLRNDLLAAVTQDPRIWIINVHGPGGVGKSALVNWAAYEFYHQRTFEAILHLTAKDTVLTGEGIAKSSRSLYSLENLLDQIADLFDETIPDDLESKKDLAIMILSTWSVLLVLDNMETVNDDRILAFVQNLPPDSLAKVLITSRQKTGSWELPFPIAELSIEEVTEFLATKCDEMGLECPRDRVTAEKVWVASGGLPLAIQWILGRSRKITGGFEAALDAVAQKDSPVLEFSFGNIWRALTNDAKAVLAALTIFNEPPTLQLLLIAINFQVERAEKALAELIDVTLVSRNTQSSDGRTRFVALPITMAFARHHIAEMGEFETSCRQRVQQFTDQMDLRESEIYKFRNRFEAFGLIKDHERKAAILCQRGESEMFTGNVDVADQLFKQAREMAPESAYVHAMSASYELARNRIGKALDHVADACARVTTQTGELCYTIKARIFDIQRDRNNCILALETALRYAPDNDVLRHQYGVALSRAGKTHEAIQQFTKIIEREQGKVMPSTQLLMALKTRMINLKRLGQAEKLKADKMLVNSLFSKYPHLQTEQEHFVEFMDANEE